MERRVVSPPGAVWRRPRLTTSNRKPKYGSKVVLLALGVILVIRIATAL
jgi:hypothetical protein